MELCANSDRPGLYLPSEIVLNTLIQMKSVCIVQLFRVRRVSREWRDFAAIAIKKAGIIVPVEGESEQLTLSISVPNCGVIKLEVLCDTFAKVFDIDQYLSLMFGCLKLDGRGKPEPNISHNTSHWTYSILLHRPSGSAGRYVYEYEDIKTVLSALPLNNVLYFQHRYHYQNPHGHYQKYGDHEPHGTYPPELIRPQNNLLRMNKDSPICMITHPTKALHAFFRCVDPGPASD